MSWGPSGLRPLPHLCDRSCPSIPADRSSGTRRARCSCRFLRSNRDGGGRSSSDLEADTARKLIQCRTKNVWIKSEKWHNLNSTTLPASLRIMILNMRHLHFNGMGTVTLLTWLQSCHEDQKSNVHVCVCFFFFYLKSHVLLCIYLYLGIRPKNCNKVICRYS